LSTRLGLAVRLLMTPGVTQVEPPRTCTWPDGHWQLGEYDWLRPLAHTGSATQLLAPRGWYCPAGQVQLGA